MTSQRHHIAILGGVVATLSLMSTSALAQGQNHDQERRNADTRSSDFHADVEVDPLAYAFGGYSVHVGAGYRGLRFDLGAFALDTPNFMEPNEGFQTSHNGFGLKVQYFPFGEHRGGFIGVQAELAHALIESDQSDAAHRERQLNLGLNLGWRFMLGDFYIMPWVLLTYAVGADDVVLDGKKYEASPLYPFATVHLGYRFF